MLVLQYSILTDPMHLPLGLLLLGSRGSPASTSRLSKPMPTLCCCLWTPKQQTRR